MESYEVNYVTISYDKKIYSLITEEDEIRNSIDRTLYKEYLKEKYILHKDDKKIIIPT